MFIIILNLEILRFFLIYHYPLICIIFVRFYVSFSRRNAFFIAKKQVSQVRSYYFLWYEVILFFVAKQRSYDLLFNPFKVRPYPRLGSLTRLKYLNITLPRGYLNTKRAASRLRFFVGERGFRRLYGLYMILTYTILTYYDFNEIE